MENYFIDELFDEIGVEYGVGSEAEYTLLFTDKNLMKKSRYEMFLRNSEYRITERARETDLITKDYLTNYSLSDDEYLRVLLAQQYAVEQVRLLTEA